MKLGVYGATGYVGELIVKEASRRGIEVIALGRDVKKLSNIYETLGIRYEALTLEDNKKSDEILSSCTVLINTAGPFEKTALPLVKSCIRNKVHYLDIAGEIYSFDQIKPLTKMAIEQNVMLMPGVGYGIVPSDIIADTLLRNVENHKELIIGLYTEGGVSNGTLHTILSNISIPGIKYNHGSSLPSYPGENKMKVHFGSAGTKMMINNPWRADLSVLPERYSINNFTTYMVYPTPLRILMSSQIGRNILGSKLLLNFLKKNVLKNSNGPNADARKQGKSYVYGKVVNHNGSINEMLLKGPEAYEFTVLTALKIIEFILAGKYKIGFVSPAQAYGVEWIYEIDGVNLESSSMH